MDGFYQLVQRVFLIVNAYSCKHHHLYPPPTLWTQHELGWDLSLVRLYQSINKMPHGQPSLEIHPHLIVENFWEKLSTKPLVQVLMTFWSILNINTNMLMPSYIIIQQAKYPLGNGFHPFFKKFTYPFLNTIIHYPHFFFLFSLHLFLFVMKYVIIYHVTFRPHGAWKINDHATPQHSQGF